MRWTDCVDVRGACLILQLPLFVEVDICECGNLLAGFPFDLAFQVLTDLLGKTFEKLLFVDVVECCFSRFVHHDGP